MKKYIVIALIVLVGGAMLVGPLMNGGGNSTATGSNGPGRRIGSTNTTPNTPAYFTVNGNVATRAGAEAPFDITVNQKDIATLSVKLDGEVIQTWQNPTENFTMTFVPTKVGTYKFVLEMIMNDGNMLADNRSLRVLSDIEQRQLQATDIAEYPHSELRFTQGLEFYKGKLFESTGLNGKSRICEIDMTSGEELRKIQLDGTYFGEGITILNDVIYQLTWQDGKCFTYDFAGDDGFTLKNDYQYIGEGWGLCNDGSQLIMSDGTEYLSFRNPENFEEIKRIQVYTYEGPVTQLNELEYINGKIYANVYLTNIVVVIDPATGKVLEQIDCTSLAVKGRGQGDVLNGIAHNPATGKTYMTGKNWPFMYEVSFSAALP